MKKHFSTHLKCVLFVFQKSWIVFYAIQEENTVLTVDPCKTNLGGSLVIFSQQNPDWTTKICSIRSVCVQLLFSILICIESALTTSVHVCVFYAVRKRRKFSGHVSSCGPAVCCVLVGVRWSQSRFNWCQAVLCEKAIRDAPRDRKPFIRGLPPGAGLAASPRLSHCLPPHTPLHPSLLKSLIAASLPSAAFLSHSLSAGFRRSLFIGPPPALRSRPRLLPIPGPPLFFKSEVCP